ncbi:MAG: hypothetical protein GW839_05000 [Flavobacteriales bacterium]|nr:hypothetical protein [Flavobacteriia bacterium]NCP05000.1 hypothetical protein [Flavobacteriales bacterium]PIV94238.1 MAG: hypothetical protein COW44_05275 [Flavobacteriaceae bacterium CG17_big_fil_post_rev_8_21_14_2_50_33_15]PIY11337.1 MAG: hypothetical protein COZ17_07050 [Flavobacteriaceae bacterium CG_4_10_14_3_um_filter_33_47]PJB19444.1 MAG: hypothetical protein CO117_04660 [Flavobacteriaceae bacterium CG_4_9_14_3_um_filter_33_16]
METEPIKTSDSKNVNQGSSGQTIIIKQEEKKSNGIGTAGFVLAIIALFLGWIPFLGWIIWILGFIFSFIGLFKTPRGLSIAGLIISFIGIIFLIIVFGAIAAAMSN